MEELDDPNSDCVRISVELLSACKQSSSRMAVNIVPGTILLPIGMLLTGWTAQKRVYWLVPDVVGDMNYALQFSGVTEETSTGNGTCRGGHYCVIPKHPGVRD